MNIVRKFKQKFKNFSLKKSTAIFTTVCFLLSIVSAQMTYAAMPISNVSVPTSLPYKTLIPFNLGRITDAYYSNDGDIVINIQDLHSHEQTQRNISSILSILDNKFGLDDIYIEGATKTLNTKWLSDIQDSKRKQKVLDNLLASGRLSGGEYFAVKSNKNTILKGLEDKDLYSQNFNKLNEIYNKKFEIKNYLSILTKIFNKKSESYYSKENKKINKIIEVYKEGKIKTDKYIELLLQQSKKTNINLSKYKNIANFTKITSKQREINQKELKKEITELLKEIKGKTNYNEYKTLLSKSSNKDFEVEFYFDLLKKSNDLNILSDKKYKNAHIFFEYLKQNQNINTIDLVKEEKLFIHELKDKLSTTQAEKDIHFLQYNLESLSNYLTNKMSAKEYEYFSENKDKFKLLWEKYIDIDNLTDVREYFNLVEDFYNNNIERNKVFVKNVLGKKANNIFNGLRIKNSTINHTDKIIKELGNGRKIHVVITGGFHTYGFNKLLEDEKVNYIVITPNVTEGTTKADILYENIFNEQYNLENTTFANMPITEVIDILKKGEIKEVRPVGSNVEIEYVSGEILSLTKMEEQKENDEILNKEQAEIIANIILDIQELKKINRENLRAQQEGILPVSTDELEKRILEGFSKTNDLNLKKALEEKIKTEVLSKPATKTGLKNTKWYQVLTKLGWINIRESLVAILEQKDFDNIFREEVLGQILDSEEKAREKFLQEHEYYDEKEDVSIQLNTAVSSVINAMNETYKQVFGYFGIHFIAQLAARFAGAKRHKEYNLNIYRLSKDTDSVLTKAEQHTYQVKFKVYFKLHYMQIEYSTGNNFFTTAPTKQKAFNNAVKRAADEILTKYQLDKKQSMKLTIYLIREYLNKTGFNIEKNIIEAEPVEEDKEGTKSESEVKTNIISKKTNKVFKMRNHKSGEYQFNIIIPGINDSSELKDFQTVYARSPRQAIFELVYQICMATENGYLTDGIFEDIIISKENINAIADTLSERYTDSKLSEIIQNLRANSSPALNDNITVQQNRQMKIGEKVYRVIIPNFNSRPGLENYQYVYAVDEKQAIEQAVLAIIKAKERGEIRGGYYNYRAINRANSKDILNSIYTDFQKGINTTVTLIEQKDMADNTGLTKQNEYDVIAAELIKPIKEFAGEKYKDLVMQTEKDISIMLKNEILTVEQIKNLLSQLEQYLKGNIPSTVKDKKVSFGTAGARGQMGIDFDFDTVALIAQARANIIKRDKKLQKNFFLANDSRFLGKWFSIVEERIFSANQIQCYSVNNSLGLLSTPAVSYFLKDLFQGNSQKYGLAKGIKMGGSENITASHNPGMYNGAKPNGADGAQLPGNETEIISKEIENIQKQLQQQKQAISISKKENTILLDNVAKEHVQYLINLFTNILGIDENILESFKENNSSKIHLVIDGNHSVLIPEMQALCDYYGFEYEILPGTQDRDTSFEGKKPEPNEENMTRLKEQTIIKVQGKNVFGIASDPDGDRFCVFDSDGSFVNPNEIGLITLDGLLSKTIKQMKEDLQNGVLDINKIKQYQGVILKSHVTSSEIDLLAQYYSGLFMNIAFGQANDSVSKQDKNSFINLYKEGKFIPFRVDNLPVGWKNIANRQKQIEANNERFIMGVESSGGLSLGVYDKDGALATILPVLIAAINNKNFKDMLSDIHNKAGFKSIFKETSATLSNEEKSAFIDWVNKTADYQTVDEDTKKFYKESIEKTLRKLMLQEDIIVKDLVVWKNEGLKILLTDRDYNGNVSTKWVAFRASGTEPKIRIYAETAYDSNNTDNNTEYQAKQQLEFFSKIGEQIVNGSYNFFTTLISYLKIEDYVKTKLKRIGDLFAQDTEKQELEQRGRKFSRELNFGNGQSLLFDFSKTNIDEYMLKLFEELLKEVNFKQRRNAMLSGETYNLTEQRSVLHSALRNITVDKNEKLKAKAPIYVDGKDVMPDVVKVLNQMKGFSDKIISGQWKGITGKPITDVVSIGIGGSDLGPRMATEALSTFKKGPNVHFVSNVDPNDIDSTLNALGLDPETTLFIIESKTFTTEETITNAKLAKKWVTDNLGTEPEVIAKHFVAVSTNKEKVSEFGIDTNNMFEFWNWVGGRFSVWSAVGLPLMCSVGFDNFIDFLSGANEIDENFKSDNITQNIPVLMAILNVLERNFLDRNAYAILPYNRYLKLFTSHIQQVYMESLGKSVDIKGNRITDYSTGSEIYGTAGTDAQHSYLQEHHQGTDIIPVDFIGFAQTSENITDATMQESHKRLLANMLAQAEAMAFGRTYEETIAKLMEEGLDEEAAREDAKAKIFDGNRPSTILMFDKLTPRSLGALTALYEDMVATLGILWNVNAFDQMGVQLGKVNAKETFKSLQGEDVKADSSTNNLVNFILNTLAGATIPTVASNIAKIIVPETINEVKTTQSEQTKLQNLLSQLTDSQNDVELNSAVELMTKAGFKEKYIEKLLSQYFDLRNGNIPQDIYSKTEQIKFGTAGVRGIIGEEVDFLDMVIITQAISNVLSAIAAKQNINPKDIKILVGGDSRFLSKQFAEIVSKILAANGINVVLSNDDIPSPTISYYTKADNFTLSINITASHNPKEHNGYKITLGDGGQAGNDVTTMIENEIKNIQNQLAANADPGIKIVTGSEKIKFVDVRKTFIDAFITMITGIFGIDINNTASINSFKQKASKWTVVVDPKNGATKKYYAEILKFFGFNVIMINDIIDPTFGGQKPEPSFENTKQLREKVKSITEDNLLGISTDVDGDRFAVVDKNGNFVTANEIGTILLNFRLHTLFDNLISNLNAAQGNKQKQNEILKKFLERKFIVSRNCATTHVLDDLAADITSKYYDKLKAFDLDSDLLELFKNCVDVKEINVGFKYFAQEKHDTEDNGNLFLLGVESSGGISIAEWVYDKCGFLANIMLLFVLVENSKQPEDILSDVYSNIAYAPQGVETSVKFREIIEAEGKLDTPEQISAEAKKRQENLMSTVTQLKKNENLPAVKNLFTDIDSELVIKEIRDNDGIKIVFENGAWLLIRPSGTEPIVRIFEETKGNKELSNKLIEFVTRNDGQDLIDAINGAIETESRLLQANLELFKKTILNSVKTLQRLTYSILFKDNMEYTIVANATDLARVKEAELLSNSGIKVNLVLTGKTSLIQESDSRISTKNGDLAFCLMAKPNNNLTVYGYDDSSYGQTVNISNITEQEALIALLQHINDNSQKPLKILDLPENLNKDIVTTDVEESAKGMFSTVGVGKTTFSLFLDAVKTKKKQTDNMFIKPSLVASNLSAEQIDSFEQEDINKLTAQGVTTIIISADDKFLQDKSQTLKDLLQMAHNNGLKVMFNYTFNLKERSINDFEKWILTFNDNFQQFKENGGLDGLQLDLSQNGKLANNSKVLSLLSELSKIVNEQNVGSFLSIKMPSDIYPTEFLILCNNEGIKLVADYDSPLVSIGLSNLKTENMIINISADKNGFISIPKLSALFEKNKVSMLSFDSSILETIDTSEGFSFNGLSITKFLTSIFETTPEGQSMKGINKGRTFVINRDSIIDEEILQNLYKMYTSDNIDVSQINAMLATNFKENISQYELKGFVEGLLEASELKNINATDVSFDKEEYSNLLMQTLLDYRIGKGTSFSESDLNKDLEQLLVIDNFRAQYQPKIDEVYKILNGMVENKVDTVINVLSSLKDNSELNSQEREMVLEGLLLLLLGYAKQDIIDMGNLTNEENIANIKAILRAA